jgi:hypothetical protein
MIIPLNQRLPRSYPVFRLRLQTGNAQELPARMRWNQQRWHFLSLSFIVRHRQELPLLRPRFHLGAQDLIKERLL